MFSVIFMFSVCAVHVYVYIYNMSLIYIVAYIQNIGVK